MTSIKNMPKTPFKLVRSVLLAVFLISITFGAGYYFGYKGYVAQVNEYPKVNITRQPPPDKQTIEFDLFWRVWDTLQAKYYDKDQLKKSDMVYGAIKGMVAAVGDPYTVFLPPQQNRVVQEDLQGNFEGVGIQIGFKGSQLAVVAPLPDSPAEEAGVEAGDLIAGIIDENKGIDRGTVGITLPEAVQAIRGEAGTVVTLVLLREGEEAAIETDIVRESIDVPSIVLEYVGEDESIAHVSFLKFTAETIDEWDGQVVELLQRENLQGIIVDMRNNPGGYLQGAVELSSEFLEQEDVVVVEEDGDGNRTEFTVDRLGRLRNQEVVVLVNGGSASASEIFAGAMRDQKNVPLVGATTFGKGTIQQPQEVENGGGLHITVSKWLTPSGYWVNDGGLEPDFAVEDDPETAEDEQLQRAIEVLEDGS